MHNDASKGMCTCNGALRSRHVYIPFDASRHVSGALTCLAHPYGCTRGMYADQDARRARVSLTLRLICGYLLRSLLPFLTCIYETLLDLEIYTSRGRAKQVVAEHSNRLAPQPPLVPPHSSRPSLVVQLLSAAPLYPTCSAHAREPRASGSGDPGQRNIPVHVAPAQRAETPAVRHRLQAKVGADG